MYAFICILYVYIFMAWDLNEGMKPGFASPNPTPHRWTDHGTKMKPGIYCGRWDQPWVQAWKRLSKTSHETACNKSNPDGRAKSSLDPKLCLKPVLATASKRPRKILSKIYSPVENRGITKALKQAVKPKSKTLGIKPCVKPRVPAVNMKSPWHRVWNRASQPALLHNLMPYMNIYIYIYIWTYLGSY